MAILGKWTGGTVALGNPPESWTAPASMITTQDRNDGSAYTWTASTSTLTLPSSGLADGYLLIAAYEYEDTSNGRLNPQGKIVQSSGTGNFSGSPTGGYNRDDSEDRSYVRTWAFVDSPSASSTYQFQWKADTDDSTGGTVRSEFQVIPLYYSNVGIYSSSSAALYGGTTPNQVTGFTADYQSDTAAIEISANVITVKGDNKRYLALGSQFFEGRGGRTQRWHGFRIDGTKDDSAKAYSYYRNTANDESGELFTKVIDRVTTNITIDQFCYRGDGISNGQGGADADGSTPSVGDHTTVIIELNDSAEVVSAESDTTTGDLTNTSGTNMPVAEQINFNDSASFTASTDTAINCVVTGDYLFGANISMASNNVSNTGRHTMFSEFTVNGTPNSDSFAGDYLRNNQGSVDTFGLSTNQLGFEALTAGDDVGVETFTLTGSEAQGDPISPAGWTGFWGINLDTLEETTNVNTVVLNTADLIDFNGDTTPTLEFTGTSTLDRDLTYNLQIDTVNTFDSIDLGFDLKQIDLSLELANSPTDGVYIELYEDSITGTLLGTSQTQPASGMSGSGNAWESFTFTTPITLESSTKYYFQIIRTTGYDASNRYWVYTNDSDYASNGVYTRVGGTWGSEAATEDVMFRIYDDNSVLQITNAVDDGTWIDLYGGSGGDGSGGGDAQRVGQSFTTGIGSSIPLLDVVSDTDAGFANTVSGGDTDPFNSGEKADYDVQPGDALTEDTVYYWRVRATDSDDDDIYGAWATTRSFDVGSASTRNRIFIIS